MNRFLSTIFGLSLIGNAQAQETADIPWALSVSLTTKEPEALLFPKETVEAEVQVAVHPVNPKAWANLRFRVQAEFPEDAESPVSIQILHPISSQKINLKTNQWLDAKSLGISEKNPNIKVLFRYQSLTRIPFEARAELLSPATEQRSSTARFPIRCAGFELVDIQDPKNPDDDEIIKEGETVYMRHLQEEKRPLPVMPRLVSQIHGLSQDYQVSWRLTSRYSRRGDKDFIRFPEKGTIDQPASEPWKIYTAYYGHYFGGDAQLHYQVSGPDKSLVYEGSHRFVIRADNPGDEASREYIKARSGEFWYAWAICQHESRQWKETFNQFNARGKTLLNFPNFGPPDGWGIFQIDSARGAEVTTREVWDWRENVFSGLEELKVCKQHSYDYMAAIERVYPRQYEGYPPDYTPPGCETTLTWLETSILQLYNGAAIVRRMPNKYGTRSYYRSCWRFVPGNPAGKRWSFVRNRNNYVFKVIKDEVEGRLPR